MRQTTSLLASALAALAAFGVATASPPSAEARPEYSRREGKACAFCHVNARGGGPRNPKGVEYEKNGLSFKGATAPKGYGENDAFTTEENGRAFYVVKEAIDLQHWAEALRRLADLSKKEKKGPGAQLVANTIAQVDGKGRDLARAAREAISASNAKDAAEALARLEGEFRGRDPAKDLAKLRADFAKLEGAKEADAAAKVLQAQRIAYYDAAMKEHAGDPAGALAALTAFLAKNPDGPFSKEAAAKVEELKKEAANPPAMGG